MWKTRGPLVGLSAQIRPSAIPSRTTSTSSANAPVKVAVLDDYLSTSAQHFSHIPNTKASITIFKDTLAAWNHEATTSDHRQALVDRLKSFNVITAMRERTPFPGELFRELSNLKLLLVTGTQFQMFDLKTAKELGIAVAASLGKGRTDDPNRPPSTRDIKMGGAHSTTQHAWALILALARNVAADDRSVKSGGWQSGLSTNILGKTLGIVGLGRLGAATARIGVLAWGQKVVCWSANLTQEKADGWAKQVGLPVETEDGDKTFKYVSKDELFRSADIVSVHYVLSERSRGIIGQNEFAAMKRSALLVNTSRGPLVDQMALLETLERGGIKGAAVDVFDIEPLPLDSPLRSTKWGTEGRSQLLTTPHMGYVEEELMNNWYAEQAENLERWLDGKDLLNRLV